MAKKIDTSALCAGIRGATAEQTCDFSSDDLTVAVDHVNTTGHCVEFSYMIVPNNDTREGAQA